MDKSELGVHVQTKKNQFQIDFCVYIVIVRGLIDEFFIWWVRWNRLEALSEQNSNLPWLFTLCSKSSTLIFHHHLLAPKMFRVGPREKLKILRPINIFLLIYYMINRTWIVRNGFRSFWTISNFDLIQPAYFDFLF